MSAPVFEIVYRGHLWRLSSSTYEGRERLAFWAHYQDRDSGEWKPCGGRGTPGCIVPPERASELLAVLSSIEARLRSSGAPGALATVK
jgi:hypothetical protein